MAGSPPPPPPPPSSLQPLAIHARLLASAAVCWCLARTLLEAPPHEAGRERGETVCFAAEAAASCPRARLLSPQPSIRRAYSAAEAGKTLSTAPSEAVVHIDDPADPRAALYRGEGLRDEALFEDEVRRVSLRAARRLGTSGDAEPSPWAGSGGEADCTVAVHYSWDCLSRLRDAQLAGREVLVDSVLVPANTPDNLVELAAAASAGRVLVADRRAMAGGGLCAAAGSRKNFCHFAVAFPVARPLSRMKPPFVVLEGALSSHDIGQIIRTAYHFGVDSFVVSRACWRELDGRACRVAMGWAYHMDFCVADDVGGALAGLRAQGIKIYGASGSFPEFITDVHEAPIEEGGDWALLVGHLSEGVVQLCDRCVSVPQRRDGSMNVAHVAAICLYELAGPAPEP